MCKGNVKLRVAGNDIGTSLRGFHPFRLGMVQFCGTWKRMGKVDQRFAQAMYDHTWNCAGDEKTGGEQYRKSSIQLGHRMTIMRSAKLGHCIAKHRGALEQSTGV